MTVDGLTAVDVVQAGGDKVAIITGLQPLLTNVVLSGRAFTCRCAPRDNFALHRALRAAPSKSVIVCDAGARGDGGYFGELMAKDALNRGLTGLVIDGSFRDRARLEAFAFPLFGRRTEPRSCKKEDLGTIGEPITVCGVAVATGDWIIGDADALVVVPHAHESQVRQAATAVQAKEAEIERQLNAGSLLWDILGLTEAEAV